MTIIKIKRGLSANVPALELQSGELALATDTGKLYAGNGTDKTTINPDNVPSATKLETGRTINVTGDVAGTSSPFDGTENVTMSVVLPNVATPGTYTKLTIDAKGRVISAANLLASDIPTITLSKLSDAGTAASKNTGTSTGNVPIIGSDGKLDASIMPAIAISDTFVVASQTAMLALTAEIGDIAVRTDISKSYILRVAGASTLANWQELLTPSSPVQSVAGKTGVVVLTSSDVGLNAVNNYGIATQSEAEAGTSNIKYMTPLRTAQAIAALPIDGGTF